MRFASHNQRLLQEYVRSIHGNLLAGMDRPLQTRKGAALLSYCSTGQSATSPIQVRPKDLTTVCAREAELSTGNVFRTEPPPGLDEFEQHVMASVAPAAVLIDRALIRTLLCTCDGSSATGGSGDQRDRRLRDRPRAPAYL
jgi:hypothetical protein